MAIAGLHLGLCSAKRRTKDAAGLAWHAVPQPVKDRALKTGDAILTPVAVFVVFLPMLIALANERAD